MIDEETLVQWEEWSKRDDAWKLFVPSDLRQMLGEIRRLQMANAGLRGMLKDQIRAEVLSGEREEIWITPDGQIHKL